MWPRLFDQRLQAWKALREQCHDQTPAYCVARINNWWFQCPWRPYVLHWDDQLDWPDPWQLLHDNIFCDIARGLGMLYTFALLDHPKIQDAQLISTGSHNLVQVHGGKYILNWEPDDIVNISLDVGTIRYRMTQQDAIDKIR